MNLVDLCLELRSRLNRSLGSTHILSIFKVYDEGYRASDAYLDSTHYPFFHYLGQLLPCTTVAELGMDMGIAGGLFLNSCPSVEHYFGYATTSFKPRLTLSNIYNSFKKPFDWHSGDMNEQFRMKFNAHKYDCVMVNERFDDVRGVLETAWNGLKPGGLLVVSYAGDDYKKFCTVKNRTPVIIPTRYGTGVVER